MQATRWATTLSSKVKLHHAIKLRAVSNDRMARLPIQFEGNGKLVVHRVGRKGGTKQRNRSSRSRSDDRCQSGDIKDKHGAVHPPTQRPRLFLFSNKKGTPVRWSRGTPVR